jgi:hypothetical protein
VAAYGFDVGSGIGVNDASGMGNSGTTSATSWTTSGKYGNALTFNGTSSRVTVNDAPSLRLTSAMTLEAWVYPTNTLEQWRDIIIKGNDNYYLMSSTTTSSRPSGGGTFSSPPLIGPSTLPLNTWTHLAVTYDRTTLRLYVNGTQVASAARTTAIATSSDPLEIGSDRFYGQHFAGRIDEIRIYNVALTAGQIVSDMNSPISGVAPPPDTTAPSAPGTLTATAASATQINLSWAAATDNVGVTSYSIERCAGAGCSDFAQITTATTTSYDNTGLTTSTSYTYRVRAADSAGNYGAYSNTGSATTQASSNGLISVDIGAVAAAGSTGHSGSVFTVRGSGADIWAAADEFRFAYQALSGDGEITARVDSLTNTDVWAKAGAMIRENLTPGSRYALMLVTPGSGADFQYRQTANGSAGPGGTSDGVTRAPYWVRVRRAGNVFTGFISADGTTWTQRGSVTIAMGSAAYIGLAVTSHADGTLATANFSSVAIQ